MKKQTKDELIKEFTDWIEQDCPAVWYKASNNSKWFYTTSPDWNKNKYWIIDDERAKIRKKLADGETVYAKDPHSNLIVKFDGVKSGIVVSPHGSYKKGYYSAAWTNIFNIAAWEILPDCQETALPQLDLDIDTKIIGEDYTDLENIDVIEEVKEAVLEWSLNEW